MLVLSAMLGAVFALPSGALRTDPANAAVAADWPLPIPAWYWPWARWYLGRGEFADNAPRGETTRPANAPMRIPSWGWHRLAVLNGATVAEPPEPDAPPQRVWPVPLPAWFWAWAQWQLHRGPHANEPSQSPATRPTAAPRFIPPWAWRRLAVIRGETPPALPTRALASGSRGAPVETLQAALHAAGYAVGAIDGVLGARTRDGVYAFEKLHGLDPDGVVSPDEFAAVLRERRPDPPLPEPARYVYVDLGRQVLYEVRSHRVRTIVHISSGGGYTYTGLDGATHIATTPTGDYRVQRKVRGWDESYLGRLYYPSYYSGGYAIHGAARVPTHPASHGCVRIPLWLARPFFARTAVGTPVFVR